jgi:hypothetical protein
MAMKASYWERRKAELKPLSLAQLLFREATENLSEQDRKLLLELRREKEETGHMISPKVRQRLDILIAQMRREGRVDVWELSLLGEKAPDEEVARAQRAVGELAEATFQEHLPRLLLERPGQWVAFHGSKLVGYAKTDHELYRECERRQIPSGECVVRPIEPEGPDIIFFEG